MRPPPIQFDLPPSEPPIVTEPMEQPLPRLQWAWYIFAFISIILIISSLYSNDKKAPTIKEATKIQDRALEYQISLKSMRDKAAGDNEDIKRPVFEGQVKELLEPARTDADAQKLRIVLQREDNQKLFLDDVRNLAKSKSAENQAFAKLYGEPKPSKEESMKLLAQLDKNEFSEKLAEVQIKESFGDKEIRSKTFSSSNVIGTMVFGFLAMAGFALGCILWFVYHNQRQSGKLRPLGIPMQNIDWGRADRLIFIATIILLTYVTSSTLFVLSPLIHYKGLEVIVFVPIFAVIAICMSRPIFGWRISPERMGLSTKDFGKHVGWAFAAFFANIPVLFFVLIIAAAFMRFLPGGAHPVAEELTKNPSIGKIVEIFFLASVIAPLWEEFLFRGLIFPALTKAFGRAIPGALLSSFIFAAIHPQGASGVFLLMGVAMMMCAVSYQTKSLVANMILHGLHNGVLLAAVLASGPLLR